MLISNKKQDFEQDKSKFLFNESPFEFCIITKEEIEKIYNLSTNSRIVNRIEGDVNFSKCYRDFIDTNALDSILKPIELQSNDIYERKVETESLKTILFNESPNFSKNINRIESLANGVNAIIGSSLFVGKPVRSLFDYKFAGIWQLKDSTMAKTYGQMPGSVRVEDTNNDGVISNSTGKDDRVWLGTQLPNFILGMTNRFTYKNFDMSFLLYYRNGTMYNNAMLGGTMADYTGSRYNHVVMNYWTKNNPTNDFYGPGVAQPYRGARNYEDASFLRLSDITVGYNVPASVLKKKIERIRVYGQIINPGVWSKYNGLDPEYNSSTYIDDVPTITYAVGLNIGF